MSLQTSMQRVGADEKSPVYMHICTGLCTHSNQGIGPEDFQDYLEIDSHIVTTYKKCNGVQQWC